MRGVRALDPAPLDPSQVPWGSFEEPNSLRPVGKARWSHGPLYKCPTPPRGSPLSGVGGQEEGWDLPGSCKGVCRERLSGFLRVFPNGPEGLTQNGPGRTMSRPRKRLQIYLDSMSVKRDLLSSEAGMGLVISKYLILLVAPPVLNRYKRINKWMMDKAKAAPAFG